MEDPALQVTPPPPPVVRPGADVRPPPPPIAVARHVPPTHGQLMLLLGYLGAGLVLALLGAALAGGFAVATWQLGLFLCCHAVIVAASWLPPAWSTQRLDAWLDGWVKDVGGGFYGLMALSAFVGMEFSALVDDVTGFDFSTGSIVSALLPWLIGFSVDSLVNSLKAIVWPVFLLPALGVAGALFTVGIAWALFALGARVFPQPAFMTAKRPRRRKDSGDDATAVADAATPPGPAPQPPPPPPRH